MVQVVDCDGSWRWRQNVKWEQIADTQLGYPYPFLWHCSAVKGGRVSSPQLYPPGDVKPDCQVPSYVFLVLRTNVALSAPSHQYQNSLIRSV